MFILHFSGKLWWCLYLRFSHRILKTSTSYLVRLDLHSLGSHSPRIRLLGAIILVNIFSSNNKLKYYFSHRVFFLTSYKKLCKQHESICPIVKYLNAAISILYTQKALTSIINLGRIFGQVRTKIDIVWRTLRCDIKKKKENTLSGWK